MAHGRRRRGRAAGRWRHLGLLEHLERSGAPYAVPTLLWVLLGLPLLIVPAGPPGSSRTVRHRPLVTALLACIYLGGALPFMMWLRPLLS